jgi:ComF family protein
MPASTFLPALWQQARRCGRWTLDTLLPPQCLTCDAPVPDPGLFCSDCFTATSFIAEPCCRQCGAPFAFALQGGPDHLCPQCRETPPPWRQARAAMAYEAQSRRTILPLKYADRTELAPALARLMVRAGTAMLAHADLLVPVPMHPSRLRRRRYNQAALLARAVSRLSHIPTCLDALARIRATAPLEHLSAESRESAVAHAFHITSQGALRLPGRHVVLIDDVLTSGATAAACTLALQQAGVASVDILVAARVPDPRDG